MATVNYQLIGRSVYLTLSCGKGKTFRRKTELITEPDKWGTTKSKRSRKSKINGTKTVQSRKVDLNNPTIEESKSFKSKTLDKLKDFVESKYNADYSSGIEITANWLDRTIKKYFNQNEDVVQYLSYHIQKAIDNAPIKKIPLGGGKFKIGLSAGRVKGIIQFRNLIEKFEDEHLGGSKIKVSSITSDTISEFENWLHSKKYSINYVGKHLSNFKAILNEIEDIKINFDIKNSIKVITEPKEPEDVLYLSLNELETIKDLKLKSNYLDNARKWLILGCHVGQRVSDLLELTPNKIKVQNGNSYFSIKQKKTGKQVNIPIFPEAQKIIDSGFPHKISDTKFREYIKQLCQLAGLNELKVGRVKDSKNGVTVKGKYPKWQLIGTHVCRRSFCSNYYGGKIPTVVLMSISGHSTESMFLKYIGVNPKDSSLNAFNYLDDLPKPTTMRVLRNEPTGTNNQ